jgi:glycosyltransferase involved in cell wall biosynthesis
MLDKNNDSTKILFFCFGFSIHAQRRVSIFGEDSRFEVYLVSNYNYTIPNVKTICLSSSYFNQISIKENIFLGLVSIVLRSFYFILNKIFRRRLSFLKEFISVFNDFLFIKNTLKGFNPDIIFLQTLLYPSYIAFLFKRKIPIIVTFWNGDIIWWASYKGIEKKLKKKIVTYGCNRARLITVNSETAIKTCLSYGVGKDKIYKIMYPAVDLDIFKPIPKDVARKELNITNKYVIFCPRGFHGVTDYLNNDTILKAFARVLEDYPDSLLLFSNGGDQRNWDDFFSNSFKLKKLNVKYICDIKWEEMPYYYSSGDLVISLSSNDSLPNAMLEAMACEIPVIMGDIPQIKEWITDDVNGIICPVKDEEILFEKIIYLLEKRHNYLNKFIEYNNTLILKNFDSRKNIEVIKDLVISVKI